MKRSLPLVLTLLVAAVPAQKMGTENGDAPKLTQIFVAGKLVWSAVTQSYDEESRSSYAALLVGRGERRWIRMPRGEEASP